MDQYYHGGPHPQAPKSNGLAIASLVTGLVSLACLFISMFWLAFFGFIGIAVAIVGLVLGISARKKTKSGMATAGMVLNIIALALCILGAIALIACAAMIYSIIS